MYIDEHEGKDSLTIATAIHKYTHPTLGKLTMLAVDLHTGRMHQIRAHLREAGYPIVGDLMYGNPVLNRLAKKCGVTRQLLHSSTYSFFDRFSDTQLVCNAPLPDDFSYIR